jgi:hypothetical protein
MHGNYKTTALLFSVVDFLHVLSFDVLVGAQSIEWIVTMKANADAAQGDGRVEGSKWMNQATE